MCGGFATRGRVSSVPAYPTRMGIKTHTVLCKMRVYANVCMIDYDYANVCIIGIGLEIIPLKRESGQIVTPRFE